MNEPSTHVRLPLVSLNTPGLGIPERIAATVEVNLASSLFVTSDCSYHQA